MTHTPVGMSVVSKAVAADGASVSTWERASFACAHAVAAALLLCLSLEGFYRFARLFGTVEWMINFKRRRRFAKALECVFGHKPARSKRRRATLEHFRQTRCDKLFYLVFDRIPRDKAMALFSIENSALLDEAVKRGRGVYVAMSHHGPHHIAGMLMALLGYKTAGVRDRREGGIRRYVQDRFDRLYPEFGRMRVLFADSYPRDIYRCFQDGYLLGSAMDVSRVRRANQKVEEVSIFGDRRVFLSGPLRVAVRCQAPVLQAFMIPDKGFRYRLDFVGMLVDPQTMEDEDKAVAEAMRVYAANVEDYLRATPALMTRV